MIFLLTVTMIYQNKNRDKLLEFSCYAAWTQKTNRPIICLVQISKRKLAILIEENIIILNQCSFHRLHQYQSPYKKQSGLDYCLLSIISVIIFDDNDSETLLFCSQSKTITLSGLGKGSLRSLSS